MDVSQVFVLLRKGGGSELGGIHRPECHGNARSSPTRPRTSQPGLLAPLGPCPPVGAEALLSPPQRTCPTQRRYSPRTSPSGTPMTSWTRSKALSQRIHRVPEWGAVGCFSIWGGGCRDQAPPLRPSCYAVLGIRRSRLSGSLRLSHGFGAAPRLTAPPLPCCRWSLPPERP